MKGKLPKFMPDVPEVRADVADYLGEIQAWDAGVGVLLQKLEAIGELDNTLVVISGDHGMPGVPGGKCNLYDHGVGVALIARGPGVKGGRVVDDFVNLMDLAPTFLEAGGVKPPDVMTGRSFLNVLRSDKIRPGRSHPHLGRHRPRAPRRRRARRQPALSASRAAHAGLSLHPQLRPGPLADGQPEVHRARPDLPSAEALEKNTFVAFADMDASPTKAWLVRQYAEPQWQWHYDYAFAKRPAEELYDLKNDPDQTKNVAADPAFAAKKQELSERLLKVLTEAGDPRVTGDGQTFERPPFTDPQDGGAADRGAGRARTKTAPSEPQP